MDSGLPSSTDTRNEPREIDGTTYIASPLPGTAGLKLLTRLTIMVGESALVIAAKGRAALDDVPADVLAYTMQTILGRLTEDDVVRTVKELLDCVYVHGAEAPVSKSMDSHFRGRMMTLLKVTQLSLEVNYRDFFDGIRSLNISATTGSEGSKG